jgi:myo-inositol-1(or 4)-monophosphatase
MRAWDCMAGICLVREAGGYTHPFPTDGENFTKGNKVFVAGPGAVDDLKKVAGL